MPVSRATAESLASTIADLYAEAERLLIARIARSLAKGIDAPRWAELKLAEIQLLQRQLDRFVADLGDRAAAQVTLDLVKAYNRGGAAAAADIAALLKISIEAAAAPQLGIPAVELLVAETMGKLLSTHQRILRATMDAYRSVIAETAAQVLLGTQTRRQAAQAALDCFAAKGITGFIDRSGRAWNLASYTEMAMRAGTMNAAVAGHIDTMQENGLDLVIVSADGSPCELCAPHEGEVLSSSGNDPHYPSLSEAESDGLFHPGCFTAGMRVSGPAVCAADSRWYEGPIIIIRIAGGDHISVTPHHPILTPNGWVHADALREGDDVVRYLGKERMRRTMGPNDVQMPALIEEVAGALLESGDVTSVCVPSSPEQFHGDGEGGEVNVVYANGLLRGCDEPALSDPTVEGDFASVHLLEPLDGLGALGPFLPRRLSSCGRDVGGSSHGATLGVGHAGHLSGLEDGSRDDRIAVAVQPRGESGLTYADGLSCLLLGPFAGQITLGSVIEVERRHFLGHVYNLQTEDGWYAANGIVSHNCRHTVSAWQKGFTRDYPTKTAQDRADEAQRYADSQKLRYLERRTRSAKRVQAAAMDDSAAKAAAARVREYQAKIRAHVASTSATRKPWRERLGPL